MINFMRNLLIWLCFLAFSSCQLVNELPITASPNEMRLYLDELSKQGRIMDTINYLQKVERHYGHLKLDNSMPSLYSFLGVALYAAKRLDEAISTFQKAVKIYPNETRAWINLGEIQVQKFQLNEAENSFTRGFKLGEYAALPRIVRTKGWSTSWQNFETFCSDLERFAAECLSSKRCVIDTNSGFEYTGASPLAFKILTAISPNAQTALNPVPKSKRAKIWKKTVSPDNRRLKVGFVSSDFGIHPVVTLIRGFLQYLDKRRFDVHCFSLQNAISWWGNNISTSVEHFHVLESKNLHEAAEYIASFQIEILIDLNGHTMFSGLPILSYQPAPLQISYLGLPTTTSATFIDYYISDYVTIPPEQSMHFSETLMLMKPCNIANDYAQVQGAVALSTIYDRADREELSDGVDLSKASILLATLSNSQKMDPNIFSVWMNIVTRFAGSKMIIMEYAGHEVYKDHLRKRAKAHGVHESRMLFLPQHPWIDHLYAKTAIDLILDTPSKNAHTTGLDGIWAGIPTITLAGGGNAGSRAGESIATALESDLGLSYSLKDYEDLAISLIRKKKFPSHLLSKYKKQRSPNYISKEYHPPKSLKPYDVSTFLKQYPSLFVWRKEIYRQRLLSSLYDTRKWTLSFEYFLSASWECLYLQKFQSLSKSLNLKKTYHFFAPVTKSHVISKSNTKSPRPIRLDHAYPEEAQLVPPELFEKLKKQSNVSYLLSYEPLRRVKVIEDPDDDQSEPSEAASSKEESNSSPQPKSQKRKLRYPAIPSEIFDGRAIMLNIGNYSFIFVFSVIDAIDVNRWCPEC